MLRAAALALTAALALSAAASAMTPAQALAKQLKKSMQAYYTKSNPGLKITTVKCTIAKSGKSGHCVAHFTVASQHAEGVFQLQETIDPTIGSVSTKTVGVSCKDTRTGKKRPC
ncbi:MAG TPA: hypothetical protein VLV28_10025 [Gaiellaceae bacterium]|nr:hypothetical protein [Gaiellaceae bacterium]